MQLVHTVGVCQLFSKLLKYNLWYPPVGCATMSKRFLFYSRLNGQQHLWKSNSTLAREKAIQYQPGQKIHGFTVREVGERSSSFQKFSVIQVMSTSCELGYWTISTSPVTYFIAAFKRFCEESTEHLMVLCSNASLSCKVLFVQVVAVPDLFLTAVKLTHDKTGAQYLHAARDDSNNLFRLVHMSVLTSYSVSGHADECLSVSLVSSSERLPWTAQGCRTSWSTRCCAALRSIPAETPSSRCSTGRSPHLWTLLQVQRHQRSYCCWLDVNFIVIKICNYEQKLLSGFCGLTSFENIKTFSVMSTY